jgi:hypothetical protein
MKPKEGKLNAKSVGKVESIHPDLVLTVEKRNRTVLEKCV